MKLIIGGIGLIILSTLGMILSGHAPLSLALEIATLLIAIVVSSTCLVHIHQEHYTNHEKEKILKHSLINKIYVIDPMLPCCKILSHYLDHMLEPYDLPQRLKILQSCQHDQVALSRFIFHFWQYYAFEETLKDLGLSW